MGNDGGSLAKRSDLVVKPGKPAAKKLQNEDVWTLCALSGHTLEDPVVSDWQGRLYNKEAVLELLLGQRERSTNCDITKARDFVQLNRKLVKDRWICPISHLDIVSEGNGRSVVYLVPCGHCGDEKALISGAKCQVCEAPVNEDNIVELNPRDLAVLQARKDRLEKDGRAHSLKTAKKRTKESENSTKRRKGYVQ